MEHGSDVVRPREWLAAAEIELLQERCSHLEERAEEAVKAANALQIEVNRLLSQPAPAEHVLGNDAREIIARFLAEKAARSPMSGGLTADDYVGFGGMQDQADELLERIAALRAAEGSEE